MLKINIKQLVSAMREAPTCTLPTSLPEMTEGTSYLFDKVYCCLSVGDEVRLSDLDFAAFDVDDVSCLNDLYDNVLERNSYKANVITSRLRRITPICQAAAYV